MLGTALEWIPELLTSSCSGSFRNKYMWWRVGRGEYIYTLSVCLAVLYCIRTSAVVHMLRLLYLCVRMG